MCVRSKCYTKLGQTEAVKFQEVNSTANLIIVSADLQFCTLLLSQTFWIKIVNFNKGSCKFHSNVIMVIQFRVLETLWLFIVVWNESILLCSNDEQSMLLASMACIRMWMKQQQMRISTFSQFHLNDRLMWYIDFDAIPRMSQLCDMSTMIRISTLALMKGY